MHSGDSFRGEMPDRTLEVCREFTRDRCKRSENECRYAHPPQHVEVVNGRVTCCFDSIRVSVSHPISVKLQLQFYILGLYLNLYLDINNINRPH